MRMIALGALGALTVSCATSPTGRNQLILLPDDQVATMGATAFDELKVNEPLSRDAGLDGYVKCISNAILAANQDQVSGTWEVATFESDQVNAFALPGQKIGVYAGMARFADNQNQLAAVVGHEIGHVLARHGNERMSAALAAQGGMGLLQAWELGGEYKGAILGALGLGYDLGVARPHSRSQESESDTIGLVMMAKAGFDPSQAVVLWQKMGARGTAGPEFLSTHPSPESRARALTELQAKAKPIYDNARAQGRNPNCRKP